MAAEILAKIKLRVVSDMSPLQPFSKNACKGEPLLFHSG